MKIDTSKLSELADKAIEQGKDSIAHYKSEIHPKISAAWLEACQTTYKALYDGYNKVDTWNTKRLERKAHNVITQNMDDQIRDIHSGSTARELQKIGTSLATIERQTKPSGIIGTTFNRLIWSGVAALGVYGGSTLNDYRADPDKNISDIPEEIITWAQTDPKVQAAKQAVKENVTELIQTYTPQTNNSPQHGVQSHREIAPTIPNLTHE